MNKEYVLEELKKLDSKLPIVIIYSENGSLNLARYEPSKGMMYELCKFDERFFAFKLDMISARMITDFAINPHDMGEIMFITEPIPDEPDEEETE